MFSDIRGEIRPRGDIFLDFQLSVFLCCYQVQQRTFLLSSLVYSSLNEFIHYTRMYIGFRGWKFKYYKPVSFTKFIVVSMM